MRRTAGLINRMLIEVLALLGWVLGAYGALMAVVAVVTVVPSWWRGRAPGRTTRRDPAGAAGTAAGGGQ